MNASSGSICAIVVSFNPEINKIKQLVYYLAPQVETIIIIDNNSNKILLDQLIEITNISKIKLVQLNQNLGIGTAQNIGIRLALEATHKHVLLLDHDSVPDPNMVHLLLQAEINLLKQNIAVGAVGPNWVDSRTGTVGHFVRLNGFRVKRISCNKENPIVRTDLLISSGTLISLSALEKIGYMNQKLFIDHVDTEWCIRARAHGFSLFGIGNAVLNHTLGDKTKRVWLFGWRNISLHSPHRDYFQCRNTIYLIQDILTPTRWKYIFLFRLIQYFIFFSLATSPRIKRLHLMILGIYHSIIGRYGNF